MACEKCGAPCHGNLCKTHERERARATPREIIERREAEDE